MPPPLPRRCGDCEPSLEGVARANAAMARARGRRNVTIRRIWVPVVVHLCYAGRTAADARKIVQDLNRYFNRRGRAGDFKNAARRNSRQMRRALGGNCTLRMARQYSAYVRRAPACNIRFTLRRTLWRPPLDMSLLTTDHLSHSPRPTGGYLGGRRALNVWVVQSTDFLGVATFPWDQASNPTADGVVVDYRTCFPRFPGPAAFNQNKTVVHEVGHWLGLLHTFTAPGVQSGLPAADVNGGGVGPQERKGDMVPDTAPQQSATFGNPFRSSQFPAFRSNLSAFLSYMDYSDDVAMFLFTLRQRDRMHAMWQAFRR